MHEDMITQKDQIDDFLRTQGHFSFVVWLTAIMLSSPAQKHDYTGRLASRSLVKGLIKALATRIKNNPEIESQKVQGYSATPGHYRR